MSDTPRDGTVATGVDRRTVLGGAAALVGGGLTGVGALAAGPEPAAAVAGDPAAFEAGDAPTVTSNDGRVESVYLSPRIEVGWTDFADGVDAVTVVLAVGSDAGVDRVYEETLTAEDPAATPGDVAGVQPPDDGERDADPGTPDFGAVDGGIEVAFERADATERGDAVTSATLSDETLSGGETTATTLDVVLRADVTGADDEASVVRTTTVDVAVTNPAGEAGAGGEVGMDTA